MRNAVKLDRYLTRIEEYERNYPVETGKVLLYGSSFFTHWGYERARAQWAAATAGRLDVINHGFGGATVEELLCYYSRLVQPYHPAAVVLRLGHNDLSRGMEPAEILQQSEMLLSWLRNEDPDLPLVLLQAFDARRTAAQDYPRFAAFNAGQAALAATVPGVSYIELNPFFHRDAADCGKPQGFRDVFVEDGLHLTDPAYEEMARYLAPRVAEKLGK